ncbi:MAG: bifunctional phosphoribosylaminoimidazolecarboxamide formyltransferase/IMP cyclohydrolase [Bacteroidales bacterium]|nr:bifunctional phosphoribosylaminoimidazolecarboxamide formyltransferase/IMP cyclohydrolase [Bacteroidales bacterium]MCF8344142.1 bifunctional phosphoribosylaminoimidazolecarboxamide formyltransferase/IMP cyclohydrolase [Bacteroidales bacterium]MCF8349979.1 bifunctional phosphoribosylaminoimidazolecarboxamide formyltransferase/IMP cyclohydrolase [Bacteroidales bacterium]MCF8376721.1 bifunctional phosphoribosylaminoimidazolecarboxamide formyltransferase/IMP cyclohydrolase [Bacteroidales bacteriu
MKKIKNALISVFYKDGLESLIKKLHDLDIRIYSTGGTYKFIQEMGVPVESVEALTGYPPILGGRVKTLHPKVFGGILARRNEPEDLDEMKEFVIPEIDLVIVNLYPFEETIQKTTDEQEIIEKIDIGGISLIRAAAKNYKDVLTVSSPEDYFALLDLLNEKKGSSIIEDRKAFAAKAFHVSSHYDTAIFNYFNRDIGLPIFKQSLAGSKTLRYGENPHQKGFFFGDLERVFTQLHGKEISYNNLLDIDAAIYLIHDFEESVFAILKHNNACGLACRDKLTDAYRDALAGDPISAFGGVLITNQKLDENTAEEINKLFFEIILAPDYENSALELLKSKKNRIILRRNSHAFQDQLFRSALNGALVQDKDRRVEGGDDLKVVTTRKPEEREKDDLLFANKIVKHSKSNAIVLSKNKQLIASGVGQTSRVDALKQAIVKSNEFEHELNGAVMASDAFFPFADSVEIAAKAGVTAVIQPGGSVRDQESIDYCNEHGIAMVFTGTRHFKH